MLHDTETAARFVRESLYLAPTRVTDVPLPQLARAAKLDGKARCHPSNIALQSRFRNWTPRCETCSYEALGATTILRTSLNVSLTPELERFITVRVASGRCQTASEVVRAGLRLLEQHKWREDRPAWRRTGTPRRTEHA